MATVAIDFGTVRTRLAVYDRRQRRPVVRVDVPTLACLPRTGFVLVGKEAEPSIASDPLGGVDDLKSRLGGESILRNRRSCEPMDVIAQLFAEMRRLALAQPEANDPMMACTLTVPLHFEFRHRELLCAAARRAGFLDAHTIDEPVAAAQWHEQNQMLSASAIVLCDLGRTARVALLRRSVSGWRPDLESVPAPLSLSQDGLPQRLFDILRTMAGELTRRGIDAPTLLLVGGRAQAEDAAAIFRGEGWPGEVVVACEPAAASALGAIEPPTQPSTNSLFTRALRPAIGASYPKPSDSSWIGPDGTMTLGDYHVTEFESILSSSRDVIRAGRLTTLHLMGDDWLDSHVRALRELLHPALGDDWLIESPHDFLARAESVHPRLEKIVITSCGRLSSAALLDLASLATVKHIDLSAWRVRDAAADGILQFCRLSRLTRIRLPIALDRLPTLGGWPRRDLLRRHVAAQRSDLILE